MQWYAISVRPSHRADQACMAIPSDQVVAPDLPVLLILLLGSVPNSESQLHMLPLVTT